MYRLLTRAVWSCRSNALTRNWSASARTPFCSSAGDHVTSKIATDDVEFGKLDPKFLDSKSVKQITKQPDFSKVSKWTKDYKSKRVGRNRAEGSEQNDSWTSQETRFENKEEAVSSKSDEFGSLWSEEDFQREHRDLVEETEAVEEGLDDHHIRLSQFDRKHPQTWYDHRLIKLSKRGQVVEAVRLLKETMIEKDRVLPTKVSYTVVISALAKAGYTSLAFQLFFEMRERGIKAPRHVFSALFNACANCPDKQKGLGKAHYLREYMRRKASPRHYITYKAQMKAFAVTGDMRTAFATLDEALEDGNRLDVEACIMLMMACITDKDNGFMHAIRVWRTMLEHGLRPTLSLYNLLTRTVLECGVRDSRQLDQLLRPKLTDQENLRYHGNQRNHGNQARTPEGRLNGRCEETITGGRNSNEMRVIHSSDVVPRIPDVLAPNPSTENLVAIETVAKASDRLALLGGVSGLISRMRRDGVKPDVKTFTMLVDCVAPGEEEERRLLVAMETCGVSPDTPFCNLLMRRRLFGLDTEGAKSVLELMGSHQLEPDLHTYATLALMCSDQHEARRLLDDIEAQDIAPTTEVFSHLNRSAHVNFGYRLWLCQEMERRHLLPDHLFIRQCEERIRKVNRIMDNWDQLGKNGDRERAFRDRFRQFMAFYRPWLKRTRLKPQPREPHRLNDLSPKLTGLTGMKPVVR